MGREAATQSAPALLPQVISEHPGYDLEIFTLEHRRGALVPSHARFRVEKDEPMVIYRHEKLGPSLYRLQIALEPEPQFVFVREVRKLGSTQPIAPLYMAEARSDCPLYSLASAAQRLVPTGWLNSRDRVFLFAAADHPFSYENLGLRDQAWYANIARENEWGELIPEFWVPWTCLGHPSPWFLSPNEDISLAMLGSAASPFAAELAREMQVQSNLLASFREHMRLAQESCEDILRELPKEAYALPHTMSDDEPYPEEKFSAAVFLCAEKSADGTLDYKMRPLEIYLPGNKDGPPEELDLLVFNLSPASDVAFGVLAPAISIGPAFNGGTLDFIGSGLYRLKPGVQKAAWLELNGDLGGPLMRAAYAVGAPDADEFTDASDWIDSVRTQHGQILIP